MNVIFDLCPVKYGFYSRDKMGKADIAFKGKIEGKEDIEHIISVKVVSLSSCIIMAHYEEKLVNDTFDFKVSVPYGYNYKITFELLRENNEEWISYIKSFNHISVGDVFVIAGQSNAVGYARGVYENSYDHRIHNYKLAEKWDIASHPLNDLEGYNGDIPRDSGEYSQHITMAKKIITHTGVPIAFIPCAVGGTSMSRWNKRYKGDLYEAMISRVKNSGTTPVGIIWCQGSSDTFKDEVAKIYHNSLKEFISDAREALELNDLKMFIYQINRCDCSASERDENWNRIRDAHRKIAVEDENAYIVSSFGAGLMEDRIHNSPAGCDLIGERMAAVVLSAVYKIPVASNTPVALNAEIISDTEVNVNFNEETYFVSDNVNNRAYDFKIIADSGEADIESIRLVKNKAIIKTKRAIKDNGTIYGAYGAGPEKEIPHDLVSGFPMAAFMFELKK